MLDRFLDFLASLPGNDTSAAEPDRQDPRVAAAALLFHVMDADGIRHDAEIRSLEDALQRSYALDADALARLMDHGAAADRDAVDLYSFTSVLKRHLGSEARVSFIGLLWEVVYADGERSEVEDNIVWRVAELIGVDRRDRIAMRQRHAPSDSSPDD